MSILARLLALAPSAFLMLLISAEARAGLLHFDDLGNYGQPIADGYAGLNWSNFGTVDGLALSDGDSGFRAAVVSPRNVAFNRYGGPAEIIGASPFALEDLWITSVWRKDLVVCIQGYDGDMMIHEIFVTPSSTEATKLVLGFDRVDRVAFEALGGERDPVYTHGDGTLFAIDDLRITPLAAVPEPLTAPAFALAISLLLFARKKRDLIDRR